MSPSGATPRRRPSAPSVPGPAPGDPLPVFGGGRLTPREREVLRWVAVGKSDAQIAAILGCSVRTVQKHLEHVYIKLGVENRTAAAMCAYRRGLVTA